MFIVPPALIQRARYSSYQYIELVLRRKYLPMTSRNHLHRFSCESKSVQKMLVSLTKLEVTFSFALSYLCRLLQGEYLRQRPPVCLCCFIFLFPQFSPLSLGSMGLYDRSKSFMSSLCVCVCVTGCLYVRFWCKWSIAHSAPSRPLGTATRLPDRLRCSHNRCLACERNDQQSNRSFR